MTKDEIYEHLAQVYLGKREQIQVQKKPQFDAKLLINILLTAILLTSVFYGLSAFLSGKTTLSQKSIIFALNNNPIRVKYNLNDPFPQVSGFSVPIPKLNVQKYHNLNFSIRGLDEGYPGIVKIVIKNKKQEVSSYFVKGVDLKWQKISIPLSEFNTITDWTNLTDVTFVFEAWNVDKKKGIVLIDDICFST